MTNESRSLITDSDRKSIESLSPFSSVSGFETAQRMAQALATSDIVPQQFQGNIGNLLIAMELSNRTKSSIMAVMQNIYVVHGKPGWSASYCIAAVNQSGRFSEPLHFEFQGDEGTDSYGCRACTVSKSGKDIQGPLITIYMAKAEGWYDRKGSKWKTMPDLMLRYRSAAFFTRTECPDLLFGMQTQEEMVDVNPPYEQQAKPAQDIEEGEIIDSVKTVDETKPGLNVVSNQSADTTDGNQPASEEDQRDEWPKWAPSFDNWVDSCGVLYDNDAHASFKGDSPNVNADGSFKAKRGAMHKASQLKSLALADKEKREREAAEKNIRSEREMEEDKWSSTVITEQANVITEESDLKTPSDEDMKVTEERGGTVTQGRFMGEEKPAEDPYEAWKPKVPLADDMPSLLALEADLETFTEDQEREGAEMLGARFRHLVETGVIES